MQGRARKIFQAFLYELTTIIVETFAFSYFLNNPIDSSGLLSILISVIGMGWNVIFNSIFEYWEARQKDNHRGLKRRLIHAIGFEGGLTAVLVPLFSYWLNISLWQAFLTDLSLLIFFMFYAFAFQWVFDRVFDVPNSAKPKIK